MNQAGHSEGGQLAYDSTGAGRDGAAAGNGSVRTAAPRGTAAADPPAGAVAAPARRRGRLGSVAWGGGRVCWMVVSHPALWHLILLAGYVIAGQMLTEPRTRYSTHGFVPKTRDSAGYVWDLWWTAHQVAHAANPWFTSHMAAPFGVQLGFDTSMPLPGLIMTPVTLAYSPTASFSVLTLAAPGLACYLMFRTARLWLGVPGAISAGALFGLSSMLAWQDWFHLNIALGTLFLPATLEAAVRLTRTPKISRGVILGAVLGASVLVNQESAVAALLLAVLVLVPWLLRRPLLARRRPRPGQPAPGQPARGQPARARLTLTRPARVRLVAAAVTVLAALAVASPQLVAMGQQGLAGGAAVNPHLLAHTESSYGVGLNYLFAPSERVASSGLTHLAAATARNAGSTGEGMPMFGVTLTVLALAGLMISWRRRSAWLLALLWLGCAALSLGPTLWIGRQQHFPLASIWHGQKVSLLLPYTWLMRIPLLADLREADRFALLGLVGAALLAGATADWLCRRKRLVPLTAAVVALAAITALAIPELGWNGQDTGRIPIALPLLDGPIAADHSQSVVVDVPFGMRGGIPLWGGLFSPKALMLATADGHPRAISYTSWVPSATIRRMQSQEFYRLLVRTQNFIPGKPVALHATPAQLAAARQNARQLGIGWVIMWTKNPVAAQYLTRTGFRLDYRVDGASVYRPAS